MTSMTPASGSGSVP